MSFAFPNLSDYKTGVAVESLRPNLMAA